jgi:DNA invertase Pin-like site-specific DNA recombinase
MMLQMSTIFAEMERHMISGRTVAAIRCKKQHLQVYSATPYGYDRVGASLVPNPVEQDAIAKMRAWRGEGQSFRKIASELDCQGIPAKRGGLWDIHSVRRIIANELTQQAQT